MPRKKTNPTATPPEPRKRGRRSKADRPAPRAEPIPDPESLSPELPPRDPIAEVVELPGQGAALAEAERLLGEKYPHISIKPGSLQPAGGRPEFGNKRTVIILCSACNKERVLPTSDLFHVSHCQECARAAKKANHKKEA